MTMKRRVVELGGEQGSSVEGPRPADPAARLDTSAAATAAAPSLMQAGPGISKPAGRGVEVMAAPNKQGKMVSRYFPQERAFALTHGRMADDCVARVRQLPYARDHA
jgi:hypothetical protein